MGRVRNLGKSTKTGELGVDNTKSGLGQNTTLGPFNLLITEVGDRRTEFGFLENLGTWKKKLGQNHGLGRNPMLGLFNLLLVERAGPKTWFRFSEFLGTREKKLRQKQGFGTWSERHVGHKKLNVVEQLRFASNDLENISVRRSDCLESVTLWAPICKQSI